jgi:ABC-type sugar transport system substrate-binding protein
MNPYSILLSLTTTDNDYQQLQASAAEETARRLGVNLQIISADNDALTQSDQLLSIIQSKSGPKPDAIILEPVGTGLEQVARAAVKAGIGWVVMNHDVKYTAEFRTQSVPVFAVSSDHDEIGRMQGKQIQSLLPNGGLVLYIEGPSSSDAAPRRTRGMLQTKPANVQFRALKAQWTEASSYKAVSSWLQLSVSRELGVNAVVCQDDAMAIGARKAFEDKTTGTERQRWLSIPYTGVDGTPQNGQAWVNSHILAATIVVPPNSSIALEMMVKALQTKTMPPERTLTAPIPYPPLVKLASSRG